MQISVFKIIVFPDATIHLVVLDTLMWKDVTKLIITRSGQIFVIKDGTKPYQVAMHVSNRHFISLKPRLTAIIDQKRKCFGSSYCSDVKSSLKTIKNIEKHPNYFGTSDRFVKMLEKTSASCNKALLAPVQAVIVNAKKYF